ncbi:MAG TPA: tetratricopeptide repeat protein [Alphaproteobacteria bacterium]|nr:tetratricopeptide repeat protein [Alphaproteobacteria bacterium]
MRGKLGKYVSAVSRSKDGKSLFFKLKGDYGLRHFNMGGSVIIDLLAKSGVKAAGKAAAVKVAERKIAVKPARKSPARGKPVKLSATAPVVKVNTVIHKGYTRVVFEWPGKVGYTVDQSGGYATIAFSRPARLDLKPLKAKVKGILGASSLVTAKGLSVTLKVSPGSTLRNFMTDNSVIVDILEPKPKAAGKRQPAKVAKTAEAAPGTAMGKPSSTGRPVSLTPEPIGQEKEGKKSAKVLAAENKFKSIKGIKISAAPKGGGGARVSMWFDWNEPVGAAVFSRAGYHWVVFDKSKKLNIAAFRKIGGNIVKSMEQIPNKRATVIRMATVAGVNIFPRRRGLTWIIDFIQRPGKPKNIIEGRPQPNSPVGARLFLPVSEPGNAIGVMDPEVGDNLVIVPVVPLGYGVDREYVYPQMKILPSIQGVVVQPLSDDVRVRPLRQGIEVTSADGLKISTLTQAAVASRNGGPMQPFSRYFRTGEWEPVEVDDFTTEKERLMAAIVKTRGRSRERLRLKLARFYFANGFNAETIGVLSVLAKSRKAIADTPEFRGLRGGASLFMGRITDAAKDLNYGSLNNFDEGTFWRAALTAAGGDVAAAAKNLRKTAGIIKPYPRDLKIPLSLILEKAAIQVGDIKQATDILDAVNAQDPSPSQTGEAGFLEGRLMELAGNFDKAVGTWENVEEGPNRQSRAKASMARVELLIKLKEISRPEAIDELEKLRFSWRGDEFEFKLLRLLGRLYIEDGDYRNGLRTLRQAATNFRDNPKTPEVTQEMVDAYDRLFLQGDADKLAPVSAIALYDEFKELSPPGVKGEEMVRKIADRLVGVDLLDQAATLLEQQIKFRLKGKERAKVGAQLANVYFLDRKYDKSIATLDGTKEAGISEDTALKRRRLRVRALMKMNKDAAAIALLKGDKSADADSLRSEIFWKLKEWPLAAQAFRNLLRASGAKPNKSLDDKQGQHVLDLAIALTLSGNERSVSRLRDDYGGPMDKSPFGAAFSMIAAPQTKGLIDYRNIAGEVKNIENFRSYLAALGERRKSAGGIMNN